MSQYRLPKVLGYIKSNNLRKGFPIINELRQLREVEAHYESEQGWMQAKVADLQNLANKHNNNITLSKGFLKRMQEASFASPQIVKGRYIQPDYSIYKDALPEGKDVADCVPEFIEIVITDAYGQLR